MRLAAWLAVGPLLPPFAETAALCCGNALTESGSALGGTSMPSVPEGLWWGEWAASVAVLIIPEQGERTSVWERHSLV